MTVHLEQNEHYGDPTLSGVDLQDCVAFLGGEQAWSPGPGPQSSTTRTLAWIQCKLGRQYLVKKFTLPWESNPGPTPNRGDLATLVASVGLKKNLRVAIRHYIQVR